MYPAGQQLQPSIHITLIQSNTGEPIFTAYTPQNTADQTLQIMTSKFFSSVFSPDLVKNGLYFQGFTQQGQPNSSGMTATLELFDPTSELLETALNLAVSKQVSAGAASSSEKASGLPSIEQLKSTSMTGPIFFAVEYGWSYFGGENPELAVPAERDKKFLDTVRKTSTGELLCEACCYLVNNVTYNLENGGIKYVFQMVGPTNVGIGTRLQETFAEEYGNFEESFPEEVLYTISYLTGARVYFSPEINAIDDIFRNTKKLLRKFKAGKALYTDVLLRLLDAIKAENQETLCFTVDHSQEMSEKAKLQLQRRAGGGNGYQGAVALSKADITDPSDRADMKTYWSRGLTLGQSGPGIVVKPGTIPTLSLSEDSTKNVMSADVTYGSISLPQAVPKDLVTSFASSNSVISVAVDGGVSMNPIGFIPSSSGPDVVAPMKDSNFFRFAANAQAVAEKGFIGMAAPFTDVFAKNRGLTSAITSAIPYFSAAGLMGAAAGALWPNPNAKAWKKLLKVYDLCLQQWPMQALSLHPVTIVIYPDPVDARKIRASRRRGKKIDKYSDVVKNLDFLGTYKYFSIPEDNQNSSFIDAGSNILSLTANVDKWMEMTMSSVQTKGTDKEGKEIEQNFSATDLIGAMNISGVSVLGGILAKKADWGGFTISGPNGLISSVVSSAKSKLGFDAPSANTSETSMSGVGNTGNIARVSQLNNEIAINNMTISDKTSRQLTSSEMMSLAQTYTDNSALKARVNELSDSASSSAGIKNLKDNVDSASITMGEGSQSNEFLTSGSMTMEYTPYPINNVKNAHFPSNIQKTVDVLNEAVPQNVKDAEVEGILPQSDIKVLERIQAFNISASQAKRSEFLDLQMKVLGDQSITILSQIIGNSFLELIVHSSKIVPDTYGTNFFLSGLYQPMGFTHEIRDGTFTTTYNLKAFIPKTDVTDPVGQVNKSKQLGFMDYLKAFGDSDVMAMFKPSLGKGGSFGGAGASGDWDKSGLSDQQVTEASKNANGQIGAALSTKVFATTPVTTQIFTAL